MNSIILRNKLRQWRAHLSSHDQCLAEQAAAKQLIASPLFLTSQHIACYLPFMGELGTRVLIQTLFQYGKKCYLPVMDVARPGHMRFLVYQWGDRLVKNHIGILEPQASAREMAPWALDLVIMPSVAFDRQGNRLGSGCGFYDRMFAGIDCWAKKPILCAYGYAQQEVEALNAQAWDVPVNSIVTDEECYHVK